MIETIRLKFYEKLKQDYPDILLSFGSGDAISDFLDQKIEEVLPLRDHEKPSYILEEIYMRAMTETLGSSRFMYISNLLEEEFPVEYHRLYRAGTLRFEVLNLIAECGQLFETSGFNEDDRNVHYEFIAKVSGYFEFSEHENSETWPTMPFIS